MPDEVKEQQQLSLEKIEKLLIKKIRDLKELSNLESLKELDKVIQKINTEYMRTLESLEPVYRTKDKEKVIFKQIYSRFSNKYINELFDSVKDEGFNVVKNNKGIANFLERHFYKLLGLARAGHRDEVFSLLLRAYRANNEKFGRAFSLIFRPSLTDQEFRLLLGAFLLGVNNNLSDNKGSKNNSTEGSSDEQQQ